ncbi:MAG: hypothetical protein COT85_01510 [Chlamydiae bacterium CG10_big_fil_rev_8_21_14_0_10_42_34]|nr:MAG: hypothetical protein COT85_01510 [Chlamydiae bacterium CG10_big_fil_rev_8_21_14_0_10_42_34]
MQDPVHIDVAIIGGGWSGILACKYMVENGLTPLVLEGSDDMGGVFKYREDCKDKGGVLLSTHLTSSKTFTEMSDFPMPHDWSEFPSHWHVIEYLNSYIDHFDIRKYFRPNTQVVMVKKEDDNWVLEDQHHNVYRSKFLVVCSGVHQHPNQFYLEDAKFKDITIPKMHSAAYKKPTHEYENKTILLYGGGETASDIAGDLCHVAKKVILSIPNGQWFVNRYLKTGESSDNLLIGDHFSSELRLVLDPFERPYCTQYIIEKEGGKCGHGIKAWESPAPYFGQFLNKSWHINHYIILGSLIPKREVTQIIGDEVFFCDGSKSKVDLIIFCSGFKTSFPFFADPKYNVPINEHFKFILHNDDPSLAYIGFARPVVGSIPAISEAQSMYVSKVFSKKIQLPPKHTRDKIIQKDKEFQKKQFMHSSGRIDGLVLFGEYVQCLRAWLGMTPNYLKLFFKKPKKWWTAVIAPYNTCSFHINDETQHERIFDTYKHRMTASNSEYGWRRILVILANSFHFLLIPSRQKKYNWLIAPLSFIFFALLWTLFLPLILYRIIKNRIQERRRVMEVM